MRGGQRALRQGFKSRQPGFISPTVTEQVVSQFSQENSKRSYLHSSVDIGLEKPLFASILDTTTGACAGGDLNYPQQAELNLYIDGGRKICIMTLI